MRRRRRGKQNGGTDNDGEDDEIDGNVGAEKGDGVHY